MVDPADVYEDEPRRSGRPAALRITLGVVGTLLGVLVIFAMLFGMLSTGEPVPNVPVAEDAPTPAALLEEVRAHEAEMLSTYGWVDREEGLVRIPIDLAVEKLIDERGEGR